MLSFPSQFNSPINSKWPLTSGQVTVKRLRWERVREDTWTFGRRDLGAGSRSPFEPALPGLAAPVSARFGALSPAHLMTRSSWSRYAAAASKAPPVK